MLYKIKQLKDKLVDDAYKKAMRDLNKFYELNWTDGKPQIIIIDNRKMFDLVRGEKSKDWVTGWSVYGTILIFLLNRKNYTKESCHTYSEERYKATIKHELSHSFFFVVSKNGYCPSWFKEGVSIYTSGQNKWKKQPEKLSTFLSFEKSGSAGVYKESGFVVHVLVEKFGKKKLFNLIKQSKDSKNPKNFKKLFSKIYKIDLNYKSINKIYKEVYSK